MREFLDNKKMTLAQLADAAGLDPSLLSRLAAENDSTRRAPQIEHIFAIARGLETSPAELAHGTAAAKTLSEWVPASTLETETKTREAAQKEAASLKSRVKELEAQLAAAERDAEELANRLAAAEKSVKTLEREAVGLRARTAEAERQQREAQQLATKHQRAIAHANAEIEKLEVQARNAKSSAATAWTITGLGAVGMILSGTKKGGRWS